MGTRADFYVGRGPRAEWIGSIAWDGYPDSLPMSLRRASSEQKFRDKVAKEFDSRDDVTLTAEGWPWPWDDSRTTDYAYAFEDGVVWASMSGHEWFKAHHKEPDHDELPRSAVFPNMKSRASNPPLGSKKSGLIVFGG